MFLEETMATAPEATKMREMAMPVKIGKLVVDIEKLLVLWCNLVKDKLIENNLLVCELVVVRDKLMVSK